MIQIYIFCILEVIFWWLRWLVSGLSSLRLLSLLDLSSTLWSTFLLPSALWCRRGGGTSPTHRPVSETPMTDILVVAIIWWQSRWRFDKSTLRNLRTVLQISCELVFPIPGSDVAWAWCKPHFFAHIQRTRCNGCNSIYASYIFFYKSLQLSLLFQEWNEWDVPLAWLRYVDLSWEGKWQLYLWVCSAAGVPGPNLL